MTEIKISILGANAEACKSGPLTAGMVGIPVEFTFDTGWDGLNVIAVFQAGDTAKDVLLDETVCTTVPHEVLQEAGAKLRIGVEGRNAAGNLVIPTTWATVGTIMAGANAVGDPALAPTPSQYDRLWSAIQGAQKTADQALEKSVPVDWNAPEGEPGHVLNRTHWVEGVVEIMPETAIVVADGEASAKAENTPAVVVGETYTVNFRGTPYVCTAVAYDPFGSEAVFLGNLVGLGGADTGEPFVAMCLPADFFDDGDPTAIGVIPYDGLAGGTVSIYQGEGTIHKLPNKYLDLDWLPITKLGKTILAETTFHTENKNSNGAVLLDETLLTFEMLAPYDGSTLTFVFDGKEYVCKVDSGESSVYIGNYHLANDSNENTGEPFVVAVYKQAGLVDAAFCVVTSDGAHTMAIYENRTANKLPEKFLPDSVDGIVIRSSTPDSAKRFKLTVDDSGTITAKEV